MKIQSINKWRRRLDNNILLAVMALAVTALCSAAASAAMYLLKILLDLIVQPITLENTEPFRLPPFGFDWAQYKWGYLAGAGLGILLALRLTYKVKKDNIDINEGQDGEERLCRMEEVKEQYKAIPKRNARYDGTSGIIVASDKIYHYIDTSTTHNLILGTTRSGKGQLILLPFIEASARAKKQPSMIIDDPKGEFAVSAIPNLEKQGYRCYVLNLINPDMGIGYNPLELMKIEYMRGEHGAAQQLARSFAYTLFHNANTRNIEWEEWAIALATALFLSHVIDCVQNHEPEKINMYSCYHLVARFVKKKYSETESMLDHFFDIRPDHDIAKLQYASCETAAPKTRAGIVSMLLGKFGPFVYTKNARMTAQSTVDFESIGFDKEHPTAVFMVTPDYDRSLDFLVSLFVDQVSYVLSKRAAYTPGKECFRRVDYILDELGNFPPVPNLSSKVTVGAGSNQIFTLVVQDYEQLYSKYTREEGQTIKSNCGNTFYILTTSYSTAEEISRRIGSETKSTYTRNEGPNGLFVDTHLNEGTKAHPLLSPNRLLRFRKGEIVVLRPLMRADLKGRDIDPYAIHNTGKYKLKYAYTYLKHYNTKRPISTIEKRGAHADVELESILYRPEEYFESEVPAETKKQIEAEPIPNDTLLSELLNQEELTALSDFIAIDNDYPNMTYHEYLTFIFNLLESKLLSEEDARQALRYVEIKSEQAIRTS